MPRDLSTLFQFASELQRATSLDELLRATGVAVRNATAYSNVWLAAIESGRPRRVRILSSAGAMEPILWERAPLFPVDGDAMLEEIVSSTHPVVVADARTDPRTDKAMIERLGNRTIINVPLVIGEERLGALGTGTFAPEPPRPPSPEQLETLVIYAALLAGAFQRLKLLDAQRTLQRHLQAAQRMESLGVLAGGVAHDFNNLLTVIINSASFVRDGTLSFAQRADLDAVLDAAERATQLTRQLLAMGRKQPLRLTPLEVASNLRAIHKLLRRILPENIAVKLDVAPGLPTVLADSQQLDQALMNLCVNARDAMPDGGTLTLAARPTTWTQEAVAHRPGTRAGSYVSLCVEDTGHGMTPEVLEHALEPFFTTKPLGKGTGLGLAVVFGIVEQHRGILECKSAPGAGTAFCVHLPVVARAGSALEAQRSLATEPAPRAASFGVGRVLLAEDEPAVRNVAQRVLEGAGYHVTAVGDGRAAVEKSAAIPFDLVILDAVMPEASGKEAWSRIRAARPEARFLIVTGHSAEKFPPELLEESGAALLHKPFKPAELLHAVRAALEFS